MASQKMIQALNDQIQKELESSYIYLQMEIYFAEMGIHGFRHFFGKQVAEEKEHAEDFMRYVIDINESVKLQAIAQPNAEFSSILDVFEKALDHEKFISKSIREILELAIEEKDYASENFLRKYVDEQVEEEATFQGYVDLLKFIKDDAAALMRLDSALAQRQ